MNNEEGLLRTYVARFNAHDIEAVMDSFDDEAVVIDHEGRRFEGRDAIRGFYEWQFRILPDGRCELRHVVSRGRRTLIRSPDPRAAATTAGWPGRGPWRFSDSRSTRTS